MGIMRRLTSASSLLVQDTIAALSALNHSIHRCVNTNICLSLKQVPYPVPASYRQSNAKPFCVFQIWNYTNNTLLLPVSHSCFRLMFFHSILGTKKPDRDSLFGSQWYSEGKVLGTQIPAQPQREERESGGRSVAKARDMAHQDKLRTFVNTENVLGRPTQTPGMARSMVVTELNGLVGLNTDRMKPNRSSWFKQAIIGKMQEFCQDTPMIDREDDQKIQPKNRKPHKPPQRENFQKEKKKTVTTHPHSLPPQPHVGVNSDGFGNIIVTMASVASLVSLGSTSVSQSGFRPIWVGKRWRNSVGWDPSKLVNSLDAVAPPPAPPPLVKKPTILKDTWKGLRRRKGDEDEIADEEAALLDVSIPGVTKRRKGRKWSKASRKAARLQAAREAAPVKVEILEVGEEGMMADELAYNLAISEGEIFGYLFSRGMGMHGLQSIDRDVVKMICREYDVEVIDADPTRVEDMARKKEILDEEDLDSLEDRPPVLTIMGHVDHGKTTLLDYIRTSKVVASEAGGITQGIGAYVVPVPIDGKLQTCVFLDTPGHEAFGAMRARGARVTDIAIIVVAADDGIRPQTNEAIAHAKAAGVPIVIAINKIDRDGANPDRVMEELASIGLMPESWGGDVPVVQVSALKGDNVDELLETVMLVAELQDLKANPHRSAKGTVIEAGLDKFKGPVATFIVQNGTLKKGDIIVSGAASGKVRALFDEKGNLVDQAGPSIPVQVIGLDNVPIAGDEFEVVSSLDAAREKAEACAESLQKDRIAAQAGYGKVTLASLASAVSRGTSGLDVHQLNIVLKVDVQGSIEAITQALRVLPQDNVSLKFLLQSPGDVSTSDIDLAVVSEAIILGFNVKAPGPVKTYADNKGIEIRLYKVIYDLIDDVRNAMEGLLEPVEEQVTIGAAEVRAVFTSGSGRVAGCMVTEGKVVKDCGIRVLRNGKTVYVGVLNSLRRVKEIAKEVNAGLECGIGMDDFNDWAVGDLIEAFKSVKKKRTLEEASATMAAAIERTQQ
ncbi:hypothetical protein RHSIM_Rhsim06G0183300 [Rhododendron simsii]|uniref:Translation initiation factor IF-2, chloroplastic n=1 Tax=Rhododendron simsii TaxID=118357 RepID=A0A834GV08_RHOSS|nr:hypothetical protein RHSIM_Rhsim06G0183300 [Rhododendron simsii]